jgi:hypothetical protein
MNRDAHLTFMGHIAAGEGHLLITGPTGEVRIEGEPGELLAVRDLLRQLTGLVPLGSLIGESGELHAEQEAVLDALERTGSLLDRGRAWYWFHELSANPPAVPVPHDPMTAYSMPRLAVSGNQYAEGPDTCNQAPVDVLASNRQSADLWRAAVAPGASLNSAIWLATSAYVLRPDGRRPVASGGALYPLHFWVIGGGDLAAPRRVLGIDHDHGVVRDGGELSLDDLQQLFVPDPEVAAVLERGAAVIVIAADPRRVTHKYGNRGWRFAMIECGAVMHHIMLAAASRKTSVRPIGGYFDLPVQRVVCDPALPLLVLLVMAER